MAYTLIQARKLLSSAELTVFEASRPKPLGELSPARLRSMVERTRKLRDKYQDLYRRQTVATRTAPASKRSATGGDNQRTRQKAELFGEVLARYEAELKRVDAAAKAAAKAAEKAARLAAKEAAKEAAKQARESARQAKAAARDAKASGASKGTKAAKGTKTVKDATAAKDAKPAKALKSAKDTKAAKGTKGTRVAGTKAAGTRAAAGLSAATGPGTTTGTKTASGTSAAKGTRRATGAKKATGTGRKLSLKAAVADALEQKQAALEVPAKRAVRKRSPKAPTTTNGQGADLSQAGGTLNAPLDVVAEAKRQNPLRQVPANKKIHAHQRSQGRRVQARRDAR